MILTTTLRLVLGTAAPNKSVAEFRHEMLMKTIAKLFNSGISRRMQDYRLIIVRYLSLGFGVNSKHVAAAIREIESVKERGMSIVSQ